ncbi:hypothetical protein S144_40 [Shewanella sp. phage 1/44]|uniref:hypothetical protein n=1 Tax=Shewanella sp. phage 1/44 TaxID=1458862 RepID=UPI0004F92511|nr:hypothetical protein S144_40 [Shewanella sp. phage 1/44]AHK11754.1 hypothetical protein S144_40 [Shewanella sp. phage 1/44]
MGLPVTVYRWDDVGAPQLIDRKPSEIIDVLKKCLVDGYGSKQSAGWTVSFENAGRDQIVFTNDPTKGTGNSVKLYGLNNSNAVNGMMYFDPAFAYSDIDTPIKKGYRAGFHPFSATFNNWMVIATSSAFYLITSNLNAVSGYDTRNDAVIFVGDFNSVLPLDVGRFVAINNTVNNGDESLINMTSWAYCLQRAWYDRSNTQSGYSPLKVYNADNSDTYNEYGLVVPSVPNAGNSVPDLSTIKRGLYFPVYIQMKNKVITDPSTDINGVALYNSTVSPTLRGFLNGLLVELSPRYSSENWPVFDSINGKTHLLMRCMTTSAFVWLNCEEW